MENDEQKLREIISRMSREEFIRVSENLYSRAKELIVSGEQVSQQEIAQINRFRKIFSEWKESGRDVPVGPQGDDELRFGNEVDSDDSAGEGSAPLSSGHDDSLK